LVCELGGFRSSKKGLFFSQKKGIGRELKENQEIEGRDVDRIGIAGTTPSPGSHWQGCKVDTRSSSLFRSCSAEGEACLNLVLWLETPARKIN
jgi:hypothetical protein